MDIFHSFHFWLPNLEHRLGTEKRIFPFQKSDAQWYAFDSPTHCQSHIQCAWCAFVLCSREITLYEFQLLSVSVAASYQCVDAPSNTLPLTLSKKQAHHIIQKHKLVYRLCIFNCFYVFGIIIFSLLNVQIKRSWYSAQLIGNKKEFKQHNVNWYFSDIFGLISSHD